MPILNPNPRIQIPTFTHPAAAASQLPTLNPRSPLLRPTWQATTKTETEAAAPPGLVEETTDIGVVKIKADQEVSASVTQSALRARHHCPTARRHCRPPRHR